MLALPEPAALAARTLDDQPFLDVPLADAMPPGVPGIGPWDPLLPVRFVTVLARETLPWIALSNVQHSLQEAWWITPEWRVGHYLLMPSVLHFFCAPSDAGSRLDDWMKAWQRRFEQRAASSAWRWQVDYCDALLGPGDCYRLRWDFLRHHPVREGIVPSPDDWPHQGRLHDLLNTNGSNSP